MTPHCGRVATHLCLSTVWPLRGVSPMLFLSLFSSSRLPAPLQFLDHLLGAGTGKEEREERNNFLYSLNSGCWASKSLYSLYHYEIAQHPDSKERENKGQRSWWRPLPHSFVWPDKRLYDLVATHNECEGRGRWQREVRCAPVTPFRTLEMWSRRYA